MTGKHKDQSHDTNSAPIKKKKAVEQKCIFNENISSSHKCDYFINLERINKVIFNSSDYEQMLKLVLEEVLTIFKCDRAWLLFPCDPASDTWRVPMECTVKEFPGAFQMDLEIPMTTEIQSVLKAALASAQPVRYDPETEIDVPDSVASKFQVKAQMVVPLYLKTGKPWLFGIHQCSHERIWREDEAALFQDIAHRISDSLASLLIIRDLRESEENYRLLTDSFQQGVCIIQASGPVYTNKVLSKITGYSHKEILSWNNEDLMARVHPGDRKLVTEQLAYNLQANRKALKSYSFRLISKDKKTKWIHISSKNSKYKGETSILATLTDITELKETEQALRESEELYRYLYDTAIIGLYRTRIEDGKILKTNKAHALLLGYESIDELLNADVYLSDFYPENLRKDFLEKLTKKGEVSNHEIHIVLPNGTQKDVSVSAKIYPKKGFIEGAVVDITESKITKKLLIESEEKYRVLYHKSQDAYMQLIPGGAFINGNDSTIRMFGCKDEDEFAKCTPADLSPEYQPDGRLSSEKAQEMMETAIEKGSHFFEWKHKRIDGDEFDATVLLNRLTIRGEEHLQATVRDITARKQAEEKLRIAYSSINSSSDYIIWLTTDGEIVYANDSAVESSGYSKEELLTMNGMQLDISLTKAEWKKLVEKLRDGMTLTVESQLTKKDGTTIPVETISNYYNNSSGEFVFAFSRDITKRKLAERELAESEEKFSKSFQTGAALMAISSVETGEYFEVNQAFLKTLGYSRKEVIGKKPEELKILADLSQRKAISKMVKENGYARDVEIEILTKNGDKRIGLFSADVISVKEKPYLLTLMNDVTERREAEKEINKYKDHLEVLVKDRTQELEKAQHELLIKEKLATLGQLTATVSHEIRNPLSTVRTAVFSIEKAVKNNDLEKVGHILKLAERNIVRCDNIINELLGYTRKRELFSIRVDFDEWLTSTLSEFDISSEVDFIENLQSGAEVLLDTEHFRRVMVNLVDNALHSLVDNKEGEKILTISTRKSKNNLELIIKDTGVGIKKENIERIFEPLFSTKSFGIGLGLPVVKQIVEEHGGTILIKSEEGQGSKVSIVLPLKYEK